MTSTQLETLANLISNQTFTNDWKFYLVLVSLVLIGSFFGAYIKSYATEKAKNSAIMSDLSDIKTKLSETTRTTEKIKNELSHEYLRRQSLENLKREKLEEYFRLVYLSKASLQNEMLNAFYDVSEPYDPEALDRCGIIQRLYFPELRQNHLKFSNATSRYEQWSAIGRKDKAERMLKGEANPVPSESILHSHDELWEAVISSVHELVEAGNELAERLNS
ncbi:hypothetical protein [Reinekea marinisedimentorum]|uniref:Uncharacterized protein n=1 Tax=Reinekea marinisedimentorum TaxID=230495 RepID=A0A4R3HRF2_9GAMM|nr:hypothetical protein [Reinekea marinisedimentorum]TCS35687.1 hypothetical protein BCF53_1328 [Reinekea marinisedimentorum]